MDLKDMILEQFEEHIQEQKTKLCRTKTPYMLGYNYLIRTVTMIYTGKLVVIYQNELAITNAAWIPETDRWADSCARGTFKEVEPYPSTAEVIISRGGILDAFVVDWELPSKQK